MYVKMIPRELAVTVANDPCTPVDGFFFIWTSMIGCIDVEVQHVVSNGEQWKSERMVMVEFISARRSNGYPR